MSRRQPAEKEPELPELAEDLSADDDLLSWILVDQLGALPNQRLGVHPQQVKFVGPVFKTEEVLKIVRETVVQNNLQQAMLQLQEFHVIKSHLSAKQTDSQRDRCIQHLRRYLLLLLPSCRIEIHTTSRYSHITGHSELAVFATRPFTAGAVVQELQGSVVPLPEKWRAEMDIGDDFADRVAAEGKSDCEDDTEHEYDDDAAILMPRRDKEKTREQLRPAGARRSDRTRRRDFSIVWSELKRCYQLFLGPARFLNHDCSPNVELLRQGKYVTFRVVRPVKIGDELTTFYGEDYFGKDNNECLCLTCEQNFRGAFASNNDLSRSRSRAISASATSLPPMTPEKAKRPRPTSLGNISQGRLAPGGEHVDNAQEESSISRSENSEAPTQPRAQSSRASGSQSVGSVSESESDDPEPVIRERSQRAAAKKVQPGAYLKRLKKNMALPAEEESSSQRDDDDYPEEFPRCATCVKALSERVWFNNHYFKHCARCTRHALIFELPWPAHRSQDVLPYPPPHLIPNGYIPPRVTSVPLPTLDKIVKKKIVDELSLPADTRDQKRARQMRARFELENFIIDQLREQAWALQVEKEESALAKQTARVEALRKRLDGKRKRDENRIKGSGVWSRYEYLSDTEVAQREAEKHAVLTGTRRGGRFRAVEDEEEMLELAKQKARRRKTSADEREEDGDDADAIAEAGNAEQGREEEYGFAASERRPYPAQENANGEWSGRIACLEKAERQRKCDAALSPAHTTAHLMLPRQSEFRKLPFATDHPPSCAPARIQSPIQAEQAHASDTQPSPLTSVTSTNDDQPKRRGRPPGTGKHQRTAAARSTTDSLYTHSNLKGKGKALPLHVITSGIEIPDEIGSPFSSDSPIYLGETASAIASELQPSSTKKRTSVFPVLGGILLPPPHRPGQPSVDSTSRAASGADESPKSTSEGGGVECVLLVSGEDGNPIVFDDDESDRGGIGMREEIDHESSIIQPMTPNTDGHDGSEKKRTFYAMEYPTHSVQRNGRPRVSLPL